MCNQDVGVGGDSGIVAALAVGDAIAHKHRNAVELNAIYFDTGVAEIMYVGIESVNVGTIQAIVMVTADEYLVAIRQIAEPVHEVYCLGFASVHGKVTGMYHYIGIGQIPKPTVAVVSIREMQDFHR